MNFISIIDANETRKEALRFNVESESSLRVDFETEIATLRSKSAIDKTQNERKIEYQNVSAAAKKDINVTAD